MFYNEVMEIKFDLCLFLNKTYPNKLKKYSRDCFLDDLFCLLIEDNNILNRNNEQYCFGNEITSRIFNGQSNLPHVIQCRINNKTFTNKEYINNAKKVFNKSIGETNVYSICIELWNILKDSSSFEDKYTSKIQKSITEKEYYSALWFMLCLASLSPNKNESHKKSQKRRLKKQTSNESIFYLSQKEKEEKAKSIITFLKNFNNHLNINNLEELLDAIVYCKIKIPEKDKECICYNFLKDWTSKRGKNDIDSFLEPFEDCKKTFIDCDFNLNDWKQASCKAYVKIMLDRLKEKFNKAKETGNYYAINNLYYDYLLTDSFFKNEKFFLDIFAKNQYFLPDFNEHITQSLWTYCNNVAVFAGNTILKNRFIDFIYNNKIKNADNPTIIDRCNALINKCLYSAKHQRL